jgi:hypothetical protein
MGSYTPEAIGVLVDDKGEAVRLGNASFPDVAALRVALAFHFFRPSGGRTGIGHEEAECL